MSEWICSERLQWAEISFSGSRQEGRCEMGEALSSPPPPPPPWWTGVENVFCGPPCVDVLEQFGSPAAVAIGNANVMKSGFSSM